MDHAEISGGQLDVLLEEFTVPQVVELLVPVRLSTPAGCFGALIGDEPATAQQRAAFEAAVHARLPAWTGPP